MSEEEESKGNAFVMASKITKFPTFLKEHPEFWITQIESAFRTHDITRDQTKFDYVVQYAPPEVYPHIVALAIKPPEENKYEAVKKRILDAFSESEEARIRRILQGQNIGGKKPSHYLLELRNTAGTRVSDTVIRSIFIEQLPEQARYILAATEERDLDKLATIADRIIELHNPTSINMVEQDSSNPGTKSDNVLMQIMARLDKIEARLKNSERNRSKSRTRSKSRERKEDKPYCYYHYKFGTDAMKCQKPCNWDKRTQQTPEN